MTTRIVSAVFVVAITVASGATAFAHGDDGVFSGTEAVPADGDPLTVSVRARLLYVNDNEPAPGATVTADAVDAAGVVVPSTPLTDNGDGTYEGTLALTAPGAWTVRFTATTPNAATEIAYAAEEPSTTTPVPTTTTDPSPRTDSDSDDGGGAGPLVLGVLAVAVLVAGGWFLWRRRA